MVVEGQNVMVAALVTVPGAPMEVVRAPMVAVRALAVQVQVLMVAMRAQVVPVRAQWVQVGPCRVPPPLGLRHLHLRLHLHPRLPAWSRTPWPALIGLRWTLLTMSIAVALGRVSPLTRLSPSSMWHSLQGRCEMCCGRSMRQIKGM